MMMIKLFYVSVVTIINTNDELSIFSDIRHPVGNSRLHLCSSLCSQGSLQVYPCHSGPHYHDNWNIATI